MAINLLHKLIYYDYNWLQFIIIIIIGAYFLNISIYAMQFNKCNLYINICLIIATVKLLYY